MVEVFFFFFGNLFAIFFLYFFILRPDKTDALTIPEDDNPNPPLPPGAIYVPSAEGKRAPYGGVNSQEELDETLALARQILEAQRKRVRDNNLGTPEDLGFDTPTGRL